jgi:predicted dehydrogenase
MTKPIRVGFIGLNSSERVQYAGAWGLNAHLPYLKQSEHYTITALCNSSQESAEKAIRLHGLDASKVKAYGDPESLANDPDVDIVVCSVKVQEHYKLVRPAVLAAKSVFCEWPLASNLTQMKELATIAEHKKTKTIVGLQGRNGPYVQAIRKHISDVGSQLGQVLSTSLVAYSYFMGLANPTDVAYMAEIENGGNLFTITSIHCEYFHLNHMPLNRIRSLTTAV